MKQSLKSLILVFSLCASMTAVAETNTGVQAESRMPKLHVAPNTPLGKGKGAVPGRVAWIHSPGVAKWDGHNHVSQDKRNGTRAYKTFVDFIAHPDMGGKCLLFLIDGTYGLRDVNGAPSPKWQKEPFCGDWACSLIASQDALAADAVAMDMLIGEWPEFGSFNYCDEYLEEAATIPNAPSGTVYKVEGKPLTEPLGLMEHWNNPKDRKYKSIDLQYRKF